VGFSVCALDKIRMSSLLAEIGDPRRVTTEGYGVRSTP